MPYDISFAILAATNRIMKRAEFSLMTLVLVALDGEVGLIS